MATGDIYKVTLEFSSVSTGVPQTTGFAVRQDGVAHDGQAVMSAIYDAWDVGVGALDGIKTIYSSDVALTGINSRRIDPLEATIEASEETFPVAGTGAGGTALAPATSMLASLRTANIGRRYRGRMYWPAPDEAVLGSGFFTSTSADLLADNLFQLLGVLNAIGLLEPMVVYSKTGAFATEVTNVLVDQNARGQSRRKAKNRTYSTGS